MKKSTINYLLILIILLAFQSVTTSLLAQAPQKMSYQAVIRNSSSQLVVNKSVGMRISILKGSESGVAVYTETQKPTTNANGLATVEIGAGTTSDNFSAIDWENGTYFIKTETDPAGGTNYTIPGISQLLSVPYALYAAKVENDKVNDADADPANEIQVLSKSGNTVTLSKGGGSVSVDDADAEPANELQNISKTGNTVTLSKSGGSFTDAIDDADADPTNEIQTITLTGNNLVLSKNGGTVPLPTPGGEIVGDNWGTQTTVTDITLGGSGTLASPLTIAQQAATNGQVMKWNGNKWTPGEDATGGGGLTLPYSQTISNGGNAFSVTNSTGSAIEGISSSATSFTIGVKGETSSSYTSSSGVYGKSTALTGNTYGVRGETSSTLGYGVYGYNSAISGGNCGIYGESASTSGTGIYGKSSASSGQTYGVRGLSSSTTGYGVYGFTDAASGTATGVYGATFAPDGKGVTGYAPKNGVYGLASSTTSVAFGVLGETSSSYASSSGVYGKSTALTGNTYGVRGETSSTGGKGVYGINSATSGSNCAIYGESFSTSGTGVIGSATAVSGLTYGVRGFISSTNGAGVYGRADTFTGTASGVSGETYSPEGKGISGYAPTTGVYGHATSVSGVTFGVKGETNSTNGFGVYGSGPITGVRGVSNDISGSGVSGSGNVGVSGISTGTLTGAGVSGTGGFYGIYGNSPAESWGAGVYGTGGYCGVHGKSDNGNAGIFEGRVSITGTTNLNSGIPTGIALACNGVEALWSNGTYFSWGFGASSHNYFDKPIAIGGFVSPGSNMLVVNGTAAKPGSTSWDTWSDIRLKDIHGNYEKGLIDIIKLQPVNFSYKVGNACKLPSDKNYVGFIAQQVQKVFPEAVSEGNDGYLTLDVNPINVALVNAIKELKAENEMLKAENKLFNTRLDNLEKIIEASAIK